MLNALNGLRYAYDEAADLARVDKTMFDRCFDTLERTMKDMSKVSEFRSGMRGGQEQLDYWSPLKR